MRNCSINVGFFLGTGPDSCSDRILLKANVGSVKKEVRRRGSHDGGLSGLASTVVRFYRCFLVPFVVVSEIHLAILDVDNSKFIPFEIYST